MKWVPETTAYDEHVLVLGRSLAGGFEYQKAVTKVDSTTEDFLSSRRRRDRFPPDLPRGAGALFRTRGRRLGRGRAAATAAAVRPGVFSSWVAEAAPRAPRPIARAASPRRHGERTCRSDTPPRAGRSASARPAAAAARRLVTRRVRHIPELARRT